MEHSPGRVGSCLFWILLFVTAVLAGPRNIVRGAGGPGRMEVLAYDYHRVFNHDLQTGSCLDSLKRSSTEGFWDVVKCKTQKSGKTVRHELPKEKKEVVTLASALQLFDLGGLCDGVLASSLGLLHNRDCAMVELAKEIPFTDKTITFAQYTNIRIAIETTRAFSDDDTQSGTYVNDVTYGAFEVITVTLFFNTTSQCAVAKSRGHGTRGLMSRYLAVTENLEGLRRVRVCTFSTTKNILQSRDFWLPSLNLVRRYLYQQEAHMDALKGQNMANDDPRRYPLRYGVGGVVLRIDPKWLEATVFEVLMAARKSLAKDEYDHYCEKGRYKKKCARLAKVIQRSDSKVVKLIHTGRQRWYLMTTRSATRFVDKMKNRVTRMSGKLDKTVSRVVESATRVVSGVRVGRLRGRRRRRRKNRKGKRRNKSRNRGRSKRRNDKKKGKPSYKRPHGKVNLFASRKISVKKGDKSNKIVKYSKTQE